MGCIEKCYIMVTQARNGSWSGKVKVCLANRSIACQYPSLYILLFEMSLPGIEELLISCYPNY